MSNTANRVEQIEDYLDWNPFKMHLCHDVVMIRPKIYSLHKTGHLTTSWTRFWAIIGIGKCCSLFVYQKSQLIIKVKTNRQTCVFARYEDTCLRRLKFKTWPWVLGGNNMIRVSRKSSNQNFRTTYFKPKFLFRVAALLQVVELL